MFFEALGSDIKIESVHRLSWTGRDVVIPPKRSFAISFRIHGSSRFIYGDKSIAAKDNALMYFPKGLGYKLSAGAEELYAVNFEASGEISSDIELYMPQNTRYFKNSFEELYDVWLKKDTGYYFRAMSLFYAMLSETARDCLSESQDPAFLRIKPAIEKMNSEYTNPDISVSALAEAVGVSETYFRRVFSRIHGTTPLEYINGMRISYAKELLKSGFYSVEQVAYECGFTDPKYFSTVFKRVRGISPSEYKRK